MSASAFYRHLTNQLDFTGTILDYLDPEYATPKYLVTGFGRNFGLCVTLHKQAGNLTGWVNYTLARSLRTFNGETYPSNHERIHELDAVVNYTHGRWDFGSALVLASGTPYTAAESFYLVGGALVPEMSPKNSVRLRPYVRLDVSATHYFRKTADGRGHGLTFAIYNVIGYKNDVFLQLKMGEDGRSFSYAPMALYLRWMPSVSYFYKF